MPKTRQQRLAEERAGHPPSPPQHLEDKPRARTRAKTPNVPEVAGPVVPATQPAMPGVPDTQSAMPRVPDIQSAIPGVPDTQSTMPGVLDTHSAMPAMPDTQSAMPGEPRAILRIWVDVDPEDSERKVGDAVLQDTIPSSRVPELVTFLENIHNQEKNKEVVGAIPSENHAANKPPKVRKRSFRRNPLNATSSIFEPQPETTSLDMSTAGGIFYPQAGPFETAPETTPETAPESDPDTDTDTDTETDPETAFPTAPNTAPEISPVAAPETPRGSKWSIGNLFQPRSIKKFFGFSPLDTVPESPESLLQTPTMSTTQTPTAVSQLVTVPVSLESLLQTPTPTRATNQTFTAKPASARPNSRRSSPISARDARAKERRHKDSMTKLAKSTTRSGNQSNRRSRARKASPASGETGTTCVEEEQFFDIVPTYRAEREARRGEAEDPQPASTIRWPISRSLIRMNQQMNKRKRDDEPVAGPGSVNPGLAEADFSGKNDDQPDKIRRTSGTREFTSQVAASKTPIPITNPTGTFKVPSPGDSDWSDSASEGEGDNTAGSEESRRISPPTQSDAVRKAREKLQKFKPRNPSRLIQSSRAYPSPSSGVIGEPAAQGGPEPQAPVEVDPTAAVDLQPPGRTTGFNAFEDWSRTAPPVVVAAVDTMEVDNNMAGAIFERGLWEPDSETGGCTNRFNAFEEWSRTASPTVLAVLDEMEVVDKEIAGQAFESGLDKSAEN